MTTPVPSQDSTAVVELVTAAILAGATAAEIKALLVDLPGITLKVLGDVFAARGFPAFITTAVDDVLVELPPIVTVAKPSPSGAGVELIDTSSPAVDKPVDSPAKPSAPRPVQVNPWAGNDFIPTSVLDHVNAALAKKGKARPRPPAEPAPSRIVRQNGAADTAAARAAYLVNASKRVGAAYSSSDNTIIEEANSAEDRYLAQHKAAVAERDRAVKVVAKQVAGRKRDGNNEVLLGWYAHISQQTCARCLKADGRNFDALLPPPIGLPGTVHPHDHCLPGPAHDTTDRVEDVDPGLRVSKLEFGKGSKLWDYWTGSKGFARYGAADHPWTTLKAELISEGVPAHEAGGLATNIMMATPAGRALFAKGHKGKKRSIDMTETRTATVVEVRGPTPENPDIKPGFTARAVQYGVADTYNTSWYRGVFAESLAQRMPSVVWCHDWADPVGRVVDYRDTETGLDIDVELDDFDAVPRARQAYAQLKSGSMSQFSFAFKRAEERPDPRLAATRTTEITKAGLDEFSIVLNGAVPGTHVTAIRSAPGMVDAKAAVELVTRFAAGGIELADALNEIRSATSSSGNTRANQKFEFRALNPAELGVGDPTVTLAAVDAAMADVAAQLDKGAVEAARQYFSQASSRLSELQYLLGMVPGVTPDYAWRTGAPGATLDKPVVEQRELDKDDQLLARLGQLSQRAARPSTH